MFDLREIVFGCVFCVLTCYGQVEDTASVSNSLHNGLSEKIGNFSIELLLHTMQRQEKEINFNLAPVTAWSLLAAVAEGASGNTLKEIFRVLRFVATQRLETKVEFQKLFQRLQVKTKTDEYELDRSNTIFIDVKKLPLPDFVEVAKEYDCKTVKANFSDVVVTATAINNATSESTKGRIQAIVTSDDIANANMILTSVLYFKGHWTSPFDPKLTSRQPFYSSTGEKIGEVNMMYHRYNYPIAIIKSLQARVLEMPYGKENRLSMLIMLPNPGVSLKDMFYNFNNVSLDKVFNELRMSTEEFGDEEVDCFMPRFKIESKLDLTAILSGMGIQDLFEKSKARLPYLSSWPVHVNKVLQKARIEVAEEGIPVTEALFANRRDAFFNFVVNRPFCYLIIEKIRNAVAIGGCYQQPTLY